MIGTDKQIAYAQGILRGAKIWHRPDGPGRGASQMAAIAAIEALEAGRLEEAEEALQEAAPWVELAIVEVDGRPAVKAAAVIDALKGAYYAAKDRGLLTGEM